jgi:hypothetical protein
MRIYFHYGTLEEDEIQKKIIGNEPVPGDGSG